MPLIKPFQALYYSPERIKDFSKVVCPPYDVMDDKEKAKFKRRSPYNFCNILTTDRNNNYRKLKSKFLRWVKDGILIQDEAPCLYLYQQKFKAALKTYVRTGILCLLRIDKDGLVYPHEHTFGAPKRDRYYILKELKANLSPIFVIYPNRLPLLRFLSSRYHEKSFFMRFDDSSGVRNKVWRISDFNIIKKVQKSLAKEKLFIADGHHRFEVARKYFEKRGGKLKNANYILAYFTDATNGLLILPTHRIVKTNHTAEAVLKKLSCRFDILGVNKRRFSGIFAGGRKDKAVFGLYAKDNYYLFYLKKSVVLDRIFKKEEAVYKDLDVSILHKLALSLLGESDISYTHSLDEAVKGAKGERVAFILRPTPLETVFTMAKKGYRFPQKSTYFYPKLLSGIVIRRLQ
ncbi:MAG: DUF1015 domain-containing protein [Candidatus Omnitrophota bacterium]